MDVNLNEQPRFIEPGSMEEAEARSGLIPHFITRISLRDVASTALNSPLPTEHPSSERT